MPESITWSKPDSLARHAQPGERVLGERLFGINGTRSCAKTEKGLESWHDSSKYDVSIATWIDLF